MADGVETQHEDRCFALPEAPMGLQVLLPPRGAVVGFTVEAAGSADKQVISAAGLLRLAPQTGTASCVQPS